MAGTAYQGTQITMVVSNLDHEKNTTPDYTTCGVQWNWYNTCVEAEPERVDRILTNESVITFKEEKTETNAEDFEVTIIYKINNK